MKQRPRIYSPQLGLDPQSTLGGEIYDYKILKGLSDLGVKIDLKRLEVGDYQLSDRCIVELKKIPDFVDSILDGRLLEQLRYLVKFDRPILILEGIEDVYSQRSLHPNAIRGMLSTIAVSYGIPIIQTKNSKETAEMLYIIAKREQDPEKKNFVMHSKKPATDKELQEFIISSLPNVGPSMAKELLHNFRNIRKIMNSSEEELKKILSLAGINDIYSKTKGQTRTRINLIKACFFALKKLALTAKCERRQIQS